MAIYHLSAHVISRSSGRSAVAAAAYRAGAKLTNERDGVTHDYTRKRGVVESAILAPERSPEWVRDRARLWNEVEASERRKDSQTAREVEIALPKELDREAQIELAYGFAREAFVERGMIADVSIHDKGDGKAHAHILLTMRELSEEGFGPKNREWNQVEQLELWRREWEQAANKQLELSGHAERIDCRSYEERGIDKEPQQHLGPAAHAMKERGIALDILRPDPEVVHKEQALWKEEQKLWKELRGVKADLAEARENARLEEAVELAKKREKEWKAREAEEERVRKEQKREHARAYRERVKARQEGEEKGAEETHIEAPVKEDNFRDIVMPENDEEIAQMLGPPERTVEPEPPRILTTYDQAQVDPAYCFREYEAAKRAVGRLEANCLDEVNERIHKEQKDHQDMCQESADAEREARRQKDLAQAEYKNCDVFQRLIDGPGIEKRIQEWEKKEFDCQFAARNMRHQLDLVLDPEKIKKEAHELAQERDPKLYEHFKKLEEIQLGHVKEVTRERHLGHENELDRGGIEGPGDGIKRGRELGRDRGIEL